MSTAPSKSVYIVQPREESGITAQPRLVRAARVASAQSHLLGAFEVRKATPDECVDLGAKGVTIQDAE